MSDDDHQEVPYEKLIKHFDRPVESPSADFDPDILPPEAVELYDTIMADYYSRLPKFPASSSKEKSKFDLIARTKQHVDKLDAKNQTTNSDMPVVLDTADNKRLTQKEIQQIVGAYRKMRPTPSSKHL